MGFKNTSNCCSFHAPCNTSQISWKHCRLQDPIFLPFEILHEFLTPKCKLRSCARHECKLPLFTLMGLDTCEAELVSILQCILGAQ